MRNNSCNLCSFGTANPRPRQICLMSETLPESVDVMVVAEMPTLADDREHGLFGSKGLREIKSFFSGHGFSTYFTYAIKCVKDSKTRKIEPKDTVTCSSTYLQNEIATLKPKHIVVLGANAMYAVNKMRGVASKRGNRHWDAKLNAFIYPTIHQLQAQYNEQQKAVLHGDLELFLKWIYAEEKEGVGSSLFDPPVRVVDTLAGLRDLRDQIFAASDTKTIVAIDTETTGLNQYAENFNVRTIQFCFDPKQGGVCVPLAVGDDCYYTSKERSATFWDRGESIEEAVEILREILLNIRCIWHNGKYDRIALNQWGQRRFDSPILAPDIYADTMHIAHLIDENRRLGLKSLITQDLGYPTYDIPNKLTKDLDMLIPYGTKDTVASLLLAHKYMEYLCLPDHKREKALYFNVIRRMDECYTEMELKGWPVDEEWVLKSLAAVQAKIDDAEMRLHQILKDNNIEYKPKMFGSPAQLQDVIFNQLGLKPNADPKIAKTSTGGLSTGNDAVYHLKGHPFIDAHLGWKGLIKAKSTYIETMLEMAQTRGRLTTSYKLAVTVTGRSSSGKEGDAGTVRKDAVGMNLQNLPYTFDIKKCIRAREGWSILSVDLSQIELRIAGDMSGDPLLIRAYSEGMDIHTLRAMRMAKMDEEGWMKLLADDPDQADKLRKDAKPCIAKGSPVLTDRGLVAIQDVLITDKVWDGISWVKHEGVVYKGYKEVITVQGLTGTPEHRVWLEGGGLATMEEVYESGGKLRIAHGAIGAIPIRYSYTDSPCLPGKRLFESNGAVFSVSETEEILHRQHQETSNQRMYVPKKCNLCGGDGKIWKRCCTQDKQTIRRCCAAVQQSQVYRVSQLWGSRHKTIIYKAGVHSLYFSAFTSQRLQRVTSRSNKQRWSLRTWKSQIGYSSRKSLQQKDISLRGLQRSNIQPLNNLGCNKNGLSNVPIRYLVGKNIVKAWINYRSSNTKMYEHVYDIVNCGVNHRFTVSNLTVSNCNFGLIYGCSWQTLQQYALTTYNVTFSDEESQKIHHQFFSDHIGLEPWYARQVNFAGLHGYIESYSGRRRHVPNINLDKDLSREAQQKYEDAKRQIINSPVQEFGCCLKYMAVIELHKRLDRERGYVYGEVHDSIEMEVRNDYLQEAAELAINIMRNPKLLKSLGIELTVPIDAEAKAGPSLGEAKKLKI